MMTKIGTSHDDAPVKELRRYLIRNWGSRKEISAAKCEELVGAIFKDVYDGDIVCTTSSVFGKDGGIDLIFIQNQTGLESAIQVKRRQTDRPESVRCVREFIGSLSQSRYSKGYFVTTADSFSSDASTEICESVENLRARGLELSLVDGRRLYAMLKENPWPTNGVIQLEAFLRAFDPITKRWSMSSGPSNTMTTAELLEILAHSS